MASIFLSANSDDYVPYGLRLMEQLRIHGHTVSDSTTIPLGMEHGQYASDSIQAADFFIIIVGPTGLSPLQESEVNIALRARKGSKFPVIIPVVLEGAKPPPVIEDVASIHATSDDAAGHARKIDGSIRVIMDRQAEKEMKVASDTKKIEDTSATFIDETMRTLRIGESHNRLQGVFWYVAGFTALLAGAGLTLIYASKAYSSGDEGWSLVALVALKGIVVIALLAACARYAFALGKAYTNEALKNSDRIHAISFGRFYLQLYGTEAKWEETKEAFQNWNIDRQSSFSGIEVNQIDPQLLDKVVDLVKSLKPSK